MLKGKEDEAGLLRKGRGFRKDFPWYVLESSSACVSILSQVQKQLCILEM
jgi:hypothetical protein